MPQPAPNLLNDDGRASMATVLLMAHHAFRRDIALFRLALPRITDGDRSTVTALQEEWKSYRGALHIHHEIEDQRIFPHLSSTQPDLVEVIAGLSSDHRRMDPLLERGDRAFAQLPASGDAAAVVSELSAFLDAHLATEEARVVPFLRRATEFPPPASDAEAELQTQGFAWSCHGVSPQVLEGVYAMLAPALTERLPAARAAFEQRCARVWGSARTGTSRTAIPDWLPGG
jgi:hypothetical protein